MKEKSDKQRIPKISIIVPIYNIEEYLPQCIKSICVQTYENLEIILVDDGSTDNCPKICDQYAEKDSRICVIHKSNEGLVSARKAGLKAATGEYISYVDGDDWIDREMYMKLLEVGIQADIIAFAGYEEYGQEEAPGLKKNTIKEGFYRNEEERKRLYRCMMVNENFYENGILTYLWAKLIKKELLFDCQMAVPDGISYAEDSACIYPCLLKARSIMVSNIPLYHYRVRPGSMVRRGIEGEKMRELFRVLGDVFLAHSLKESLKWQLKCSMWHAMLLKNYEEIRHQMLLFPFAKVKAGMKVAIYGAGIFGNVIWNYCQNDRRLKVVGWFDQRNIFYNSQGLHVQPAAQALECCFDIMVIAITNIRLSRQIKEDFIRKGVSREKIDSIHMEILEEMKFPEYMEEILIRL